MRRLHEQFATKGLDALLFVQGSGRWGGYGQPPRNVTGSEEVQLAREYYTDHFGLKNLIAVDTAQYLPDSRPDALGGFRPSYEPKFVRSYKLNLGYPTIVIIDRRGNTRARVIGYDEMRVKKIVEDLLAEVQPRS